MSTKGNSHVKNALINILAFPGLGSLRSGRRSAGYGQVLLAVAGTVLMLVWFYREMSEYYGLLFGEVKPESIAWLGITGGSLLVISWIWACLTSLSLFKEAAKPSAPPVIREVISPAIQAALATVPQWQRSGQVIARTYEFNDFPAAMKFVNAVADLAEQAQHHPDIDVRWNKVTLALTTHDAGGLTEKDFALARACDELSLR